MVKIYIAKIPLDYAETGSSINSSINQCFWYVANFSGQKKKKQKEKQKSKTYLLFHSFYMMKVFMLLIQIGLKYLHILY